MREKQNQNLRRSIKQKERFQNTGMIDMPATPWHKQKKESTTEYEQLSFIDNQGNMLNPYKGYQRIRKK